MFILSDRLKGKKETKEDDNVQQRKLFNVILLSVWLSYLNFSWKSADFTNHHYITLFFFHIHRSIYIFCKLVHSFTVAFLVKDKSHSWFVIIMTAKY